MNRARADNVTQFARIESSNKFALTIEARNELMNVADHLSRFHVTERFYVELLKYPGSYTSCWI